jgi:hypothetical protein
MYRGAVEVLVIEPGFELRDSDRLHRAIMTRSGHVGNESIIRAIRKASL